MSHDRHIRQLKQLSYEQSVLLSVLSDAQRNEIAEQLETTLSILDGANSPKCYLVADLLKKIRVVPQAPKLETLLFENDDEGVYYVPAMYLYHDPNVMLANSNAFKIINAQSMSHKRYHDSYRILVEISLQTIIKNNPHHFTVEFYCDFSLSVGEFDIVLPSHTFNNNNAKANAVGLMYILNTPCTENHNTIIEAFDKFVSCVKSDLVLFDGDLDIIVHGLS